LWLAAWFTAGEKPIHYEEPDLRLAYRFHWNGVAAKRIQSPSKILQRVREGAGQVKKRVGCGFIALSIDNYSPGFVPRFTRVRKGNSLLKRLPELDQAADWCAEHAHWIHGLLIFGFMTIWRLGRSPVHANMSFPTRIVYLPEDSVEHEHLKAYFDELISLYRNRMKRL